MKVYEYAITVEEIHTYRVTIRASSLEEAYRMARDPVPPHRSQLEAVSQRRPVLQSHDLIRVYDIEDENEAD